MKSPNAPLLEAAISITFAVVPIVYKKVKAARKEKKRIKSENIFVLKPEIRSN